MKKDSLKDSLTPEEKLYFCSNKRDTNIINNELETDDMRRKQKVLDRISKKLQKKELVKMISGEEFRECEVFV